MMRDCKRCGWCCTHAKFSLPDRGDAEDQALWYQLHGCRTVKRDGRIFVVIPITCSALAYNGITKKYYCGMYDKRPDLCRAYQCDYVMGKTEEEE